MDKTMTLPLPRWTNNELGDLFGRVFARWQAGRVHRSFRQNALVYHESITNNVKQYSKWSSDRCGLDRHINNHGARHLRRRDWFFYCNFTRYSVEIGWLRCVVFPLMHHGCGGAIRVLFRQSRSSVSIAKIPFRSRADTSLRE